MSAPKEVIELVNRFGQHIDVYRKGKYNETQLRRDFVDPLFKALGWDMDNAQNYAEQYREVIHEDAIKIGGYTKAPDYSFRIGGTRKFFIEAKKPSIDIKDEPAPAFQLRRYAWSAKLPLSILTDFEEFAVYDCRIRPKKTDKASTGRIIYLTYKEYIEKWDEIASIFSRDAILKGSFDKYVASKKGKRGTAEVDDTFLDEIETWRESLAKNLALRNPDLSQTALNYAVQLTIDRIIFLRICEDRGIEPYGQLQSLENGANIYPRLIEIYHQADKRYNSGLFHFRKESGRSAPDIFTPNLVIDDKTLKDIFRNLYYPDSPYEFSVIGADILGSVYERFLGKVIELTSGHRAKIEEKPEVKKAGGVFYTPAYIVKYIVQNTVGRLLVGKKPKQIENLRILDPACGSGSFLIGAFQYLLDWHLDWYIKDGTNKHSKGKSPKLYQGHAGDWRLTITERKRILTNNIYGVDIDMQAVEVTKLSLLLKVLEGETQPDLFAERVLPDLGNNIKCGNSLIGTDIYQQQLIPFDEDDQSRKINPFDWDKEFSKIMQAGGFDAVIGNPPYVRQELISDLKPYLQNHYKTFHGVADLYVYFIEKGVNLLNVNGIYGVIVANKWMRANYGKPLRQWMKQQGLLEITDFGDLPVFQQATTYPCILRIQKKYPDDDFFAATLNELLPINFEKDVEDHQFKVPLNSLNDDGWSLAGSDVQTLVEKIKSKGTSLEKYIGKKIYRGILTGLNEAFVIDETKRDLIIKQDQKCIDLIKPFVVGKDVKRYQPLTSGRYLILIPKGWTKQQTKLANPWPWFKETYPAIASHLEPFAEKAQKRGDKGEFWWELRACDYYDKFVYPKIIYPDISTKGGFTYDTTGSVGGNTTYFFPSSDKMLLGILNSNLMSFYYRNISSSIRGGFLRYFTQYIETLPITIKKDNEIPNLVQQMLTLNIQLSNTISESERIIIDRQINAVDKKINDIVNKFYDLTQNEIKIIEAALDNSK